MKRFLLFSVVCALAVLTAGCKGYDNVDISAFGAKAPDIPLIDVRTADEYAEGHIPGAVNVDWMSEGFIEKVKELIPENSPVAVYCRTGRRSSEAAGKLAKAGYSVTNLTGGFEAWTEAEGKVSKYEIESFCTKSGDQLRITLIKHGTLAIDYAGLSIQVDPVSQYLSSGDYAAEFPKADVILITHEHGDHLDAKAVEALCGDNTKIYLNQSSADKLGAGEVLGNGDVRDLSMEGHEIVLEAVPAYNITPGHERFHPKGNGNGYVLTFDGFRVYVAGDTEDIPEMADLKDVDVAFLPVNQPYTMTVDQCVAAATAFNPKVLIPYHFSNTDLSALPGLLPGTDVRIRNMQ